MTEKYNDFLLSLPLFKGFDGSAINAMRGCLAVRQKDFKKGEIIFMQGYMLQDIGIIAQGAVNVTLTDILGSSLLVERVAKGNIFAGVLLCTGMQKSPFTVTAAQDCDILFIPYKNIVTPCKKACGQHNILVQNMLRLIAQKNIVLNNRLQMLSQKNIRESLLTYFRMLATKNLSFTFSLPMSNSALADYLCVNRSALQRQLAAMKKEGIIKIKNNRVTLSKKSA